MDKSAKQRLAAVFAAALILAQCAFFPSCAASAWRVYRLTEGGYCVAYGKGAGSFSAAVNIVGPSHHVSEIYCAYKPEYGKVKSVSITCGKAAVRADIPVFITRYIDGADGVLYIAVYSSPPGFTYTPEDDIYVLKAVFESGKKRECRFSIAAFRQAYIGYIS